MEITVKENSSAYYAQKAEKLAELFGRDNAVGYYAQVIALLRDGKAPIEYPEILCKQLMSRHEFEKNLNRLENIQFMLPLTAGLVPELFEHAVDSVLTVVKRQVDHDLDKHNNFMSDPAQNDYVYGAIALLLLSLAKTAGAAMFCAKIKAAGLCNLVLPHYSANDVRIVDLLGLMALEELSPVLSFMAADGWFPVDTRISSGFYSLTAKHNTVRIMYDMRDRTCVSFFENKGSLADHTSSILTAAPWMTPTARYEGLQHQVFRLRALFSELEFLKKDVFNNPRHTEDTLIAIYQNVLSTRFSTVSWSELSYLLDPTASPNDESMFSKDLADAKHKLSGRMKATIQTAFQMILRLLKHGHQELIEQQSWLIESAVGHFLDVPRCAEHGVLVVNLKSHAQKAFATMLSASTTLFVYAPGVEGSLLPFNPHDTSLTTKSLELLPLTELNVL